METLVPQPEQVFHIRIILAVIMGLSITRLLTGLVRFVQHPNRDGIYLVHLGWVIFLLTAVLHFWWFEFAMVHVQRWTLELYIFLICYTALFYLICSILFPDRMDEYAGFKDYFHSRQKWFYGLLAGLFLIDVVDTLWKGTAHFQALGLEYPIRQGLMFVFAIIAMFVTNRRFHLIFVIVVLIAQITWMVRYFQVLS